MGAAPSTDATSQQAQPVKDVAKPHNCENILKYADSTLDKSSGSAIYDQLCAGVFLNQKKKKYWVERESSNNCFMLYAQGLSITWGDDKRYWIWPLLKESSDESVVVAELLNVSWLEIHGKFDTANLSPGINYEVAFVLMLKDVSYGWEVPVNFKLSLPNPSVLETLFSISFYRRPSLISLCFTNSDKSLIHLLAIDVQMCIVALGVQFSPKTLAIDSEGEKEVF